MRAVTQTSPWCASDPPECLAFRRCCRTSPFHLVLWANTRQAHESVLRASLIGAGLGRLFRWVITFDAGARKPAPQSFEYALAHRGLVKEHVLFVGNQLDTDVAEDVVNHDLSQEITSSFDMRPRTRFFATPCS